MINKHYKEVKQAVRKRNPIDPYFVSKYSFSPYMACQHACKYCDGRAEKYYVEGDYEHDIVIRKNLPELIQKELPKLREKGVISIGSGISDPYQQVEEEERLVRKSLQILEQHDHAVSIHTKSSLILRDLDILKRINKQNGVLLLISLTTLDDDIRRVFEPGASSVEERLKTIKTFKESGISTGVLAMPFLPFITDSKNNMKLLFTKLKEIEVDLILPGYLTLRPGKQKATYLKIIEENYPELSKSYLELYNNNLLSGNPVKSYRKEVNHLAEDLLDEMNIPQQIPHYVYKNRISLTDEILVLLEHLIFLYDKKGTDISRLIDGTSRYTKWLTENRKYYLRRRNLPIDYLDDLLKQLIGSGEFKHIINNGKLFEFICKVVIEQKIFDYSKLLFDKY